MPQAATDIIERLSELPPFPKVTTRLLSMLDDDSVSLEKLSEVISTDPSFVMKVIRMSNSPFYMVSRPIESIKDAVIVLGINTLKHLTTAISIQKGLSKLQPRPDFFDMLAFWKHSYATAILSRQISDRENFKTPDRFYLAGLIHDVGKLVQANYWPEAWKAAINFLKSCKEPFDRIEQHMFSLPHKEITATLCRNWQFPDSIVLLLGQSLHNENNEARTSEGRMILFTANAIANAGGFPFPTEESCERQDANIDQYTEIMNTLGSEVEHQLSILKS